MAFTIPEYITVHLGSPTDSSAANVRVPFIDYIKNVASSEIYPTWPESALRANMYAQISFALNRIFSEWYPSRGYDFDITSDTRYDQSFVYGRDIYESVSRIADDIFNDYLIRNGTVQPLFAQYCDGIEVQCSGLSQWGSVTLAEEGLTPYEILQYYYGDDISIIFNAPTGPDLPSYPGYPLRLGSFGEDVRTIQRELNRIGQNYPAIRPRLELNGLFNVDTENAVKEFQSIFNLTPDGIVGKSTWYQIKSIYNAVKGIADLRGEGITPEELERIFPRTLSLGDTGIGVASVQYYLALIAYFDQSIPTPAIDGVFGQGTRDAVEAFQRSAGLNPDGVVGRDTWNALIQRYDRIIATLPEEVGESAATAYPGRFLAEGQSGEEVLRLQRFINLAAARNPYIPTVSEDGDFGPSTAAAVRAVQQNNGISPTGVVGPITWNVIVNLGR